MYTDGYFFPGQCRYLTRHFLNFKLPRNIPTEGKIIRIIINRKFYKQHLICQQFISLKLDPIRK